MWNTNPRPTQEPFDSMAIPSLHSPGPLTVTAPPSQPACYPNPPEKPTISCMSAVCWPCHSDFSPPESLRTCGTSWDPMTVSWSIHCSISQADYLITILLNGIFNSHSPFSPSHDGSASYFPGEIESLSRVPHLPTTTSMSGAVFIFPYLHFLTVKDGLCIHPPLI